LPPGLSSRGLNLNLNLNLLVSARSATPTERIPLLEPLGFKLANLPVELLDSLRRLFDRRLELAAFSLPAVDLADLVFAPAPLRVELLADFALFAVDLDAVVQ